MLVARVTQHLESHAFPNLYSSTSDNIGNFSYDEELYCAMFVKELDEPDMWDTAG